METLPLFPVDSLTVTPAATPIPDTGPAMEPAGPIPGQLDLFTGEEIQS